MNTSRASNSGSADSALQVTEVLFDFEGTLVDFQWQLARAVEECLSALEKAGFRRAWFGVRPNYASIYNDIPDLSGAGKGDVSESEALSIVDAVYDKYDADALTRWNLYPDTLEMLDALRQLGFRMGIVSNIGEKAIEAAIKRLGLAGRVGCVVSRNQVRRLKPDPEGLRMAAAALNAEPSRCLFIGDSTKDVDAARDAGMRAGYLAGGEDSPETMAQHPADVTLTRLGELPAVLVRDQ